MLTGTALFRLHAQGEGYGYEGQWITQVHRCGSSPDGKVPVDLASVAHISLNRLTLVSTTDTLQPGSVRMHFGSALRD